MNDPDEMCRHFAYLRVSHLDPETLERILQREDRFNLSALSRNRSLPVEQLERICSRIAELERGDCIYEESAREILDQVREQEFKRTLHREIAAEFGGEICDTEPDELTTARQITALGKKLLALEKEVVDRLAKIEERLDKLED